MRVTDLFDKYLNEQLSEDKKLDFENLLRTDEIMANAFNEHKTLVETLKAQSLRADLKHTLQSIHKKEFGSKSNVIFINREENFAKRHGRTIVFAASTAFIAVLATVAVLSTGGLFITEQNNKLTELKREVMNLKASSDGIVEGIKNNKKAVYAPANLEGSAFALNNKGYIVTSYHMVKGADSIFIRNSSTERTLTKLVIADPKLDLAVLKVENKGTYKNWQVPFSLNEKATDIGEKVFTLGYPRKEMVYGEGSLSSLSGYSNDTNMYQISIPVNPGNSGGPLLDENGNIIGVIRGKISGAEATGFAIKSHAILNSIKSCEADSTKHDLLAQNSKKIGLKKLKRSEQVKRINPYVFNVLVYKKD